VSRKMSERRRAAFLRALEESGNQTLPAERACVSRSWVCKERGLDAVFDSACRRAIEAADARLRAAEGNRPEARGWGHLDGVELVVRGTGGNGGGRLVQIARARAGQWTAASEDRFLEVLAATCNAKAAYEAAGKSKGSAYSHRKRWAGFGRRWQAAEEIGYGRIEDALLERGQNLFSSRELPPDAPMPRMTVGEAIQLLRLHRYEVHQVGKRPGHWRRPRSLDEVRDSILRKLAAFDRSRRRQ